MNRNETNYNSSDSGLKASSEKSSEKLNELASSSETDAEQIAIIERALSGISQ